MEWILQNFNDEKYNIKILELFKLITYQFTKIMNNGNIHLNLFHIFLYYKYLFNY